MIHPPYPTPLTRDFFACKMAVLRQVSALPTSSAALVGILDWPSWAIHYAVASLARDGLIKNHRGLWRRQFAPSAATSVRV